MIGKRKRETSVMLRSTKTEESSPPPAENAQDIFRKYFEAQFEPLDLPSAQQSDDDDSDDNEEYDGDEASEPEKSDWDGLSEEDEDDNLVEVIEYKDAQIAADDEMDKKARKALLVWNLHQLLFQSLS